MGLKEKLDQQAQERGAWQTATVVFPLISVAATGVRLSIYDLARMCGRSRWAARCMEQEIANRVNAGRGVAAQLRRIGIRCGEGNRWQIYMT